ncbi:hypothetical protein M758_9G151000 [Ceratodon purpureus]|nr:hypothetical protein M758_9G150000 [Ceratodon purpureus]KAG0606552.1 hypothetical protein M758_9G150400 [Ceratodon purpureus]KAG0606555.1 hypothetical protein M758_9G150700 [Ceratodon purpureus]KAG0606558.1 hypothetical protein M758_9G151000 [Ceratodon purpureus]
MCHRSSRAFRCWICVPWSTFVFESQNSCDPDGECVHRGTGLEAMDHVAPRQGYQAVDRGGGEEEKPGPQGCCLDVVGGFYICGLAHLGRHLHWICKGVFVHDSSRSHNHDIRFTRDDVAG